MLKRISVHNYNCFVAFELELPRLGVLVGSNGSGKTSLWEVLAGLQDVIIRSRDVTTAFPTRTLTRWRKDDPVQRFGLDVEVDNESYRYELEIVHNTERRLASIRRERLESGGKVLYENLDGEVHLHGDDASDEPRTSFPFNRKRSFLPDMERRHDNRRTIAFREAIARMWLLVPAPQRLEPTTVNEAYWLERDGTNFTSWFRGMNLERRGLLDDLFSALNSSMPGLQDITFERMSSEVREVMLRFRAQGAEYKLSIRELSDGQRTLVLLYGFLLGALDQAALTVFDEPEMGLSPHEMQPWLARVRKTLDDHGGQAIMISHHPLVIDYIAPASTIRFRRPNGGPTVAEEVTLKTTGGLKVSEWVSLPWVYEDEYEEEPAL
ncbi:AAA family ATPase [Polyangium spumosum]|uniref:AAA family ATPase n=1 Tax=Polyangium spumosum TaxID=889282 RepID=A0A6N7PKZ1_9BACT|nr:ATP-binding protein [Polyangium spumosum]MRG90794.1 AAA family ATPase [Polyangium spumosum]